MADVSTNGLLIRKTGGKLPLLRYIVPFTVDYDMQSFSEVCHRLSERGQWKVMTRSELVPSHEEDLYDFFYKNLTTTASDGMVLGDRDTNIGVCFSSTDTNYKTLYYHYIKDGIREVKEFYITDRGLVLFKNGISLFWYDVKVDFTEPDDLVLFQNRFKELNSIHFTKSEANKYHFSDRLKKDNDPDTEVRLYTFGNVIAKELNRWFGEVGFFPSRVNEILRQQNLKALYKEWREKTDAWKKADPNYQRTETFRKEEKAFVQKKNLWVNLTVEDAKRLADEYNMGRTPDKTVAGIVPDRAILYSYIVFDAKEEPGDSEEEKQALISEMCRYAYYFSRGYKESYRVTKDAGEEKKHMFFRHENDLWESALEGTGCFVLVYEHLTDQFNKPRSNSFYDNIRVNEMKGDYFIMLVHLLYQYYSLALYTDKISRILQQDPVKYLEYDDHTEELYDNILNYKVQLDVFFSSCMFKSVSHTTDIGRIYAYIEDNMLIQENTESIRKGLSNLESLAASILEKIQARKKERLENIVSFTGFVIGFITLVLGYDDIFSFATNLQATFGFSDLWHNVIVILVIATLLGMEFILFISLIRYLIKKKKT